MSRYIFSKNSRWYISEIFDPSDSQLQEKASYYTLTDDVTGPYYAVGTSDSASIGVSYVPVVEPAGAIEAGYINAEGNFQPLSFDGTQASDSGGAVQGLQHKIFNTGHDEPDYGGSGGATMEFYKCSYVNSDSWGGYKAVLSGNAYSFDATVTTGLTYSVVTPVVGRAYADGALIEAKLYEGIPLNGLIFYAPMNTNAGTAVTGQTLTPLGDTITYSTVSGIPCGYLNGNSVLRSSSDSALAVAGTASVSAWVKISSASSTLVVFQIGDDEAQYESLNCVIRNGKLSIGINLGEIIGTTSIDTAWHHVAATCHGGACTLYIDGVSTYQASLELDCTQSIINIGATPDSEYYLHEPFVGNLAAIRIYNRVLTAAEITALANEFTPTSN